MEIFIRKFAMGETREIPLRNLKGDVVDVAIVDAEDYERCMKYKWHVFQTAKSGKYASGGRDNYDLLHHFIIGKPPKDHVVDHKDHNGLMNSRRNLRHATRSQNSQNRAKKENCSSVYINVALDKRRQTWGVSVKDIRYGTFPIDQEYEAGILADKAIIATFGPDASTNGLLSAAEIMAITSGDTPKPVKKKQNDLPEGVFYRKDNDKYRSAIQWEGVKINLGQYDDPDEAEKAYNKKKSELIAAKRKAHFESPINRNEDGIATIPIMNNKGEVVGKALVDDDKYHELTLSAWNMSHGYAVGTIDGQLVKMHRYLLNADKVRHLNGNFLDNRLANLQKSSDSDVIQSRTKKADASSQYRGVNWDKKNKKWEAEIRQNKVRYRLGRFDLEIDAAKAYNCKAKELYEKPTLNKV